MKERTLRESNDATYIRGYWVGGQRFRRSNGKAGWYIVMFSDSVPLADYWIAEGRFHKALIQWVEARTFDIEILGEAIGLSSEKQQIVFDAIRKWDNNEGERALEGELSEDLSLRWLDRFAVSDSETWEHVLTR